VSWRRCSSSIISDKEKSSEPAEPGTKMRTCLDGVPSRMASKVVSNNVFFWILPIVSEDKCLSTFWSRERTSS